MAYRLSTENTKTAKNKTEIAVALFLVLTITSTIIALPIATAHTPAWRVPTWAYIVASPSRIGVHQTTTIVFWIDKIPTTGGGVGGDRWRNLMISVTKPDSSKETLGPFMSDPVGGSWTGYTPDQIGTYTFNFSFPGQVLSLVNPVTGISDPVSNAYVNDTYLASSAETTLTVQQDPIALIPEYPLPTEYWMRPIEGQNTEWATIASNWLGTLSAYPLPTIQSAVATHVQPNGIAPNSPHIMWTKPLYSGGVVGGSYPEVTYYTGESYEDRFQVPIVIAGRLMYQLPWGSTSTGGGYVCVDLLTGEDIWYSPQVIQPPAASNIVAMGLTGSAAPTFAQLYDYNSMNQHGVINNGYLWQTIGTTWVAYDSRTGKWLFNLTDVPTGTNTAGPNGEILRYVLNYPGRWLALWNNTAEQQGLHGALGTGTSAYQWRPVGKVVNMSRAYSWNVTIPTLPAVSTSPTIREVIPDDLLLGSFGSPGGVDATNPGCTVFAISLKPTSRGTLLWIKNYSAPAGNLTRTFGLVDTQNRVFILQDMGTMQNSGYSMDDGSLLWGPVGTRVSDYSFYSWSGTAGGGLPGSARTTAYGRVYEGGFGGIVYCYDTKNGTLLWTFGNGGPGNSTFSGLENAWGYNPTFINKVADGKLYLFTCEHSVNAPIYKGARIYCLNATTGKQIWTLLGWDGSGSGTNKGGVIADGYLAFLNSYDGQIYCVGKGPSATTVTASPKVSVHGNSVLVEGTVIDTAAGTRQKEQAARFPNGVPAVSDASIEAWMEYVYMQKPRPTDAVGVEVSLDTIDPNSNYVHIGTATSDENGMFKMAFTPEVPGEYRIIATFGGSESYYGSHAETVIDVSEAPPATTPPEYPQPIDNTLTIVGVGIAMIIAVAVATILILRKK